MTGIVVKCCVVALITCIVIVILKEMRQEWSGVCGLFGGVMILIAAFTFVDQLVMWMSSVISKSGIDKTHLQAIVKCIGITFIVDYIAGFCRGQGQLSLATAVETVGRVGVCTIALPFAFDLLELADQILSA